jgi:uncharacterized protein
MTTTLTAVPETQTQARSAAATHASAFLLVYLAIGIAFGVVLTKAEVLSWFRVQEMFRFQAFHMYGVIGSAVATAMASLWLLRRFEAHSLTGERIDPAPKVLGRGTRYWLGGSLFGVGWALVGACPGPLLALIGGGEVVLLVTVLSAVAGTWTYGVLRPRLPH